MKKLSILFILFILFSTLTAQKNWEDPIAITDSVSDNKNPLLVHSGNTTLIFYEKTGNNGVSSIYMQNFDDLHQEIELFAEEGVNYRNPQTIVFHEWPNPPDTMFYLFFESDMESSGYYNIYYSKYSKDGNFTEPQAIEISYTSCEHLRVCNNNLVWERDGNIEYCFFNGDGFTETQTLDSGNCKNPEVGNQTLAYQMLVNDSLRVYQSDYSFENNDWDNPELTYNHSSNSSLVVLNSDFDDMGDYGIIWESQIESDYKLVAFSDDDHFDTLSFSEEGPMQAHFLAYELILKDNKYPYFTECAWVKSENGNKEIFAISPFLKDYEINISNSEFDESHPKLYMYHKSYSYNVVLFWQSTRNNHEQLFIAKRTFWVGTNEKSINNHFSIHPNPASSHFILDSQFDSGKSISIDIFSISGQHLSVLYSGDISENGKILVPLPQNLDNGVYILQINSEKASELKKLVIKK